MVHPSCTHVSTLCTPNSAAQDLKLVLAAPSVFKDPVGPGAVAQSLGKEVCFNSGSAGDVSLSGIASGLKEDYKPDFIIRAYKSPSSSNSTPKLLLTQLLSLSFHFFLFFFFSS